jgi:hypothetical protein
MVRQMKPTAAPFLSYVPLAEKRPGITSLRSTFLRDSMVIPDNCFHVVQEAGKS